LPPGVLDGWRALRGRRPPITSSRGNLLHHALGVVIAAGSGGMFSFLGDTESHMRSGSGIGVVVMYGGFERTTRPEGPRVIPSTCTPVRT
jgi:hypothetical protein